MMYPAKEMRPFAEQILSVCAPYCERIELAGSLRRQCECIHNIDIVFLEKSVKSLAGMQARIREHNTIDRNGPQYFNVTTQRGIKVDFYRTKRCRPQLVGTDLPLTRGTVLLCRTGSKNHNITIAQRAARMGFRWFPHDGISDSTQSVILAAETEEQIFAALNMDYIPPENRR